MEIFSVIDWAREVAEAVVTSGKDSRRGGAAMTAKEKICLGMIFGNGQWCNAGPANQQKRGFCTESRGKISTLRENE